MVLNEKAELIFRKRYALDEKETWEGLSNRIGTGAAIIEADRLKYEKEFAEIIFNMHFLPGGRILRNIGRPRGTVFNCFVLPLNDSMEEIGEFQKNCGILWSEGGGVGCNASFLRPKGAKLIQKGGESSGPISFLKWANAGADCIKTGGSRRAAALSMMLVSHPDIIEFINAKLVEGALSNFNISVGVTEQFLEAVEADAPWDLQWQHKVWNTVKARDIWDLILTNMVKCAEPGIINWDNLRSNNSYYFDSIISTNPCGEVCLPANGVCCLGSLVLPKFITGNVNTNWKLMEKVIHLSVRFLDNIIQINRYSIEEIKRNAFDSRRIGLGIMGLAEYLFAKKLRYGSHEAIEEIERLMKFIRNASYEASIKLSEEKGAFPKFDSKEYSKAHFIRTLPANIRMDIKKFGIRNVTLLSVAPNGTISLIPEVTGSAEPLPFKAFVRNDEISIRAYVHPIYKEIIQKNEPIPSWFVDTQDLTPQDHFNTQVIIQRYIDSAISKTINAPKGFKKEQLSSLLLEYIRDLKGVTLYVDGSREGQILNPLDRKETEEYLKMKKGDANAEEQECTSGTCEL